MASDNFLLVAAIDFGTTFSSYAFSFKATEDNPHLPEVIRTNKNWGEALGFQSHKCPTTVLTTAAGDFRAFGYDAELMYSQALMEHGSQDADLLLFRHFKMILHKANVELSTTIESIDGRKRQAIDIFVHAIRYLKEHMLSAIKDETGSKPDTKLIRWVVTVPAIWSEGSKNFMREAAFRAGCIDKRESRRLVLALEPEAASLCCRRLKEVQCTNTKGLDFPMGTKYLVLDCGGGTVDITAYRVEFDRKLKELHRASGGPWGGIAVDKNFKTLLGNTLGNNFLNTFQAEYPHEWLQFLTNFEKAKKAFKPDGSGKITLSVPYAMGMLFHSMEGKSMDEALGATSGGDISFRCGTLAIQHEAALGLFRPVTDSITAHLRRLVESSDMAGLSYILMVGGFSESIVLQDAIRAELETRRCKVCIPYEAQLVIVKGAVLFGHTPQEIGSRKARYSFGCEVNYNFDRTIHDEKYKMQYQGRDKCTHVFSCFVQKDEEIIGGKTINKTFKATHAEQSEATLVLLSYDAVPHSPVQYTDAPGMKKLASIEVTLPGHGLDRKVELGMTFGNTEIQVDALNWTTGQTTTAAVNFLS